MFQKISEMSKGLITHFLKFKNLDNIVSNWYLARDKNMTSSMLI